MSSTVCGGAELIGGVTTMALAAPLVVPVVAAGAVAGASVAAMAAAVSLPCYAAYKGISAYASAVSNAYEARKERAASEWNAYMNVYKQKQELQNELGRLRGACGARNSLVSVMNDLEKKLSSDFGSFPLSICGIMLKECARKIEFISDELSKRQAGDKYSGKVDFGFAEGGYQIQTIRIVDVPAPSGNVIGVSEAEQIAADLANKELKQVKKELSEFMEIKPETGDVDSTGKRTEDEVAEMSDMFEAWIKSAAEYRRLSQEYSPEEARAEYIRKAFAKEMHDLGIVEDAHTKNASASVQYMRAGSQTIRKTQTDDGQVSIEVLTSSPLTESTQKALRLCQMSRCRKYDDLKKNLYKHWGIRWDYGVYKGVSEFNMVEKEQEDDVGESEKSGGNHNAYNGKKEERYIFHAAE